MEKKNHFKNNNEKFMEKIIIFKYVLRYSELAQEPSAINTITSLMT